MVFDIARDVREIRTVPAGGSQIRVVNTTAASGTTGGVPDDGVNLEISKVEINQKYFNAIVTHSGMRGAVGRARVGEDFTFRATMPWAAGAVLRVLFNTK